MDVLTLQRELGTMFHGAHLSKATLVKKKKGAASSGYYAARPLGYPVNTHSLGLLKIHSLDDR